MGKRIQAIYDGVVLRPAEPLTLEPNTEVWVTIEDAETAEESPASLLQKAREESWDEIAQRILEKDAALWKRLAE